MKASDPLSGSAAALGQALAQAGLRLACAESCTGGLAAATLTAIPGSSAWFDRAFVSYSNEAKIEMLGVAEATLSAHGAVSEQVVREMAQGALARSRADLVLALSGVAGPGGGTPAKPVGTVCLAWARRGAAPVTRRTRFEGDRDAVRAGAAGAALDGALAMVTAGGASRS